MKARVMIAVLAAGLSGCVSADTMSQEQQAEVRKFVYTENLKSSCESIGYQRDTDQWRQCIMQLNAQNQQERAAIGSALIQLEIAGRLTPEPYRPIMRPQSPAYNTNCTRERGTGNMYCTTH